MNDLDLGEINLLDHHFSHATYQGSRENQEDGYNRHVGNISIGDKSPLLKFFSVHDGHSGKETMQELESAGEEAWNKIMKSEVTLTLNPPPNLGDDPNVKFLAKFYTDAQNSLENQENISGAVSITALAIENEVVYFSWVGDCEGCLFLKDPSIAYHDPTYHTKHISTIDFAQVELRGPMADSSTSTHPPIPAACSIPCSLLSGMQDKLNFPRPPRPLPHGHPEHKHVFHEVEEYVLYEKIVPNYFPNAISRSEFDLVKLLHEKHKSKTKPKAPPTMDILIHKVGNAILTTDARITGSIQPTRSIADNIDAKHLILRHPIVMRILFPDPIPRNVREHCQILLCSDGFFSEYAFSGLADLCKFLTYPDAFFSESFYCRGQVLTERLIAAKLLPPGLDHKNSTGVFPLYDEWKACKNWKDKTEFITTKHMEAVASEEFKGVFEVTTHYNLWIDACQLSLRRLKRLWTHNVFTHMIAPHMATLMGSRDNVTLVMTPAFT